MLDPDQLLSIIDATHALAGDGMDGLAGEDLCSVALRARRLRELADHLEVHALAALDDTGHTDALGCTTAGWFADRTKLPSSVGRTQIKTARSLRHLPGTDRAWLDGDLSREHVRVLADAANPRIRAHIVALEDHLVGIAGEYTTFDRWRRRVAEVVSRLDVEGPDPDDPAQTSASWGRSGLFGRLRASFAGADVELFDQILEARTDELARKDATERALTPDLPARTRSQLRGLALLDLALHGPTPTNVDGDPTPMDEAAAKQAAKASARGPRIGIMAVLRADAAGDWPAHPSFTDATWSLTSPDGHHLALEHFESLLCDCEVHPLLVDADGNPLKLGRSTRFATLEQRRVVIARDGGCAFAGCDCPAAWIEIHHVQRWADGGTTDIALLAGLCRRHHGVTHRNGWNMYASGDGWFFWTTPSGDSFWSQRHGHQRAGPTPAQLRQPAA